ncbi:MAG: S-layer homology domain-containing protein, partial [Clostridiales bacterium]|nr:S-layer homology domain-containing protein [Clostridiales bacterium]
MKNGKPFIKQITWVLTLVMVFAIAPVAVVADAPVYLSRSEAAERISQAADAYNPLLEGALLHGYTDGRILPEQPITRAEALALLSRAFGAQEPMNEHYSRLAQPDVSFTDMPAWVESEIANLNTAGILTVGESGNLYPNEPVSAGELETYLQRLWAVSGTNPKDDFYAAVNREALASMRIRPGEPSGSVFGDLGNTNANRVSQIITSILDSTPERESPEAKIAALYRNIMNYEERNVAGIQPIRPYLDAIGAAKSLEDLLLIRRELMEATGVTMLFGFLPQVDLKNSSRHIMTVGSPSISLPKEYYTAEYASVQEIYLDYLATLFGLSGLDDAAAAESARLFFLLEQDLSTKMLDVQDYSNVDKVYNVFTMKEVQALFPMLDLQGLLLEDGYQSVESVIVNDPGILEAYAAYFAEDRFPSLQAAFHLSVILSFGPFLNEEFEKADNAFVQLFTGVQGEKTPEEIASQAVQSVMASYLEELYIERYFSGEAKTDVENMIHTIVAVYKDRLTQLDWMGEATKKMAMLKLDSMRMKIGYPDKRDDFLDDIEFKGPEEGGSYFDNVVAISRKARLALLEKQDQPVDQSEWAMSAFTVNAYYNLAANEIVFPAGILQSPFYDVNASMEENLGGIGFVIAHEITHSFDNNGAK